MSCAPVNTDVVPVTGIVASNYASWPKVVGLARKWQYDWKAKWHFACTFGDESVKC